MKTINTTETQFEIKINGQTLTVDFELMDGSWVAAHLKKAAQRYLNDKYSGEQGQVKLEAIQADLAQMHSGAAMPEKERKSPISKIDPVRKLAREMSTTFLANTFANAMGKDALKWVENPKISHLFKVTESGRVRFDLAAVDAWMVKYKDKQDFMEQARKTLEENSETGLDFADFEI